MDRYLTTEQVYQIAEKPFNVIKFGDLKKYKTLDQLFYPNTLGMQYEPVDDVLILYELRHNSGHWCVLKRILTPKGYSYHFLDSYGEIIDSQRNHIESSFRDKSGQDTPNILLKLIEQPDIHYNSIKLQGPRSSTCGRYAGLFIRYDTTVENFAKQLRKMAKSKKISIDKLVIELTEPLLEDVQ